MAGEGRRTGWNAVFLGVVALVLGMPSAHASLPVATEVCNGVDDDLDGSIDEGVCGASGCAELSDGSGANYLVCSTPFADWASAGDFCESWGYHLIDIESAAENALVVGALDPSLSFWQSGNDLAVEGDFVLSDGSAVGFTDWGAGEPNGGTTENCLYLYWPDFHTWHDAPCAFSNSGAVCEVECTPVQVWDDDDGDGYGEGTPHGREVR